MRIGVPDGVGNKVVIKNTANFDLELDCWDVKKDNWWTGEEELEYGKRIKSRPNKSWENNYTNK